MFDAHSLLKTIQLALRLDESVYLTDQALPGALWVTLFIVCLAAVSEAVGQSIVLFLNQVQPRRFVFALSLAAGSNVIGYIFWASCVWLAGRFVFGQEESFWQIASVVGLAYAPQLFAFFVLIPYFGNPVGVALWLWSMVAVVVAIRVGMGIDTWQAAAIGALSWLLLQGWRHSLGRPIYALGRGVQRRAAGAALDVSLNDVRALQVRRRRLRDHWRAWVQQQAGLRMSAVDAGEGESPHV
jgi:hypothetical protein